MRARCLLGILLLLLPHHSFAQSEHGSADLSPNAAAQAHIEPNEQAEALFNRGVAHLDAGRARAAIPLLLQALKLDPTPATRFMLGEAFEQLGKLRTAYGYFRAVEKEEVERGRLKEAEIPRGRADRLLPNLGWLSVRLSSVGWDYQGLEVMLDHEPITAMVLTGSLIAIEKGPHEVVVTNPVSQWRYTVYVPNETTKVTELELSPIHGRKDAQGPVPSSLPSLAVEQKRESTAMAFALISSLLLVGGIATLGASSWREDGPKNSLDPLFALGLVTTGAGALGTARIIADLYANPSFPYYTAMPSRRIKVVPTFASSSASIVFIGSF